MSFVRWLKLREWLPVPARRRGERKRRSGKALRAVLQVESLEDRRVPATAVFASTDVPVAIADLATVTSRLTITDSFPIEDVNVSLDIDHTLVSDLQVVLIAPDTSRVQLIRNVGGNALGFGTGYFGTGFTDTSLDDEARGFISDSFAGFPGSYRPEGSLFGLNGKDAQGTWTLEITDTAAVHLGILNDWSLTFGPGPIDLHPILGGVINRPGEEDRFAFTVKDPGRLRVSVAADTDSSLDPRLTLFGPDGKEFVRSDDSGEGSAALIDQHLIPGAYVLLVSAQVGSGSGFTGSYLLHSTFAPALSPLDPLPTRGGPVSVAVADFNGDGQLDLVTANPNFVFGDYLSVLLGNGDGSFQPERRLGFEGSLVAVTVADFNGDGRVDLLVANSSDLSVLLGNGDGSFQPERQVARSSPMFVRVADLNADGRADLITGNYGGVSILLGNGDGSFQPERFLHVSGASVAVADLNRDGHVDLVAGNPRSNYFAVFLGTGDGSFLFHRSFTKGGGALAVADLNGDGLPDLVAAYYSGDYVSVLLGKQGGSFQLPLRFTVGGNPSSVAVADLNGDGCADLVTANSSSDDVSVLLGNGKGSFQFDRRFATGHRPLSLAVADLNGDGWDDLVTANANVYDFHGDVSVLLGNGDGTFQSDHRVAGGDAPHAAIVADLNGDDQADVVVANANGVSVLLGNGDGSFQPERRFSSVAPTLAVAVADVNGDGRADLITNTADAIVSVLLGNGDGSFQSERRVGVAISLVSVADLNGDGRSDIVTFDSVLLGNGDGSFQPGRLIGVSVGRSVAVGDLNRDGWTDLVAASYPDVVSVLLGNGDGSFQPEQRLVAGNDGVAVALADFNGDGLLDIVTADSNPFKPLSVLLSNADGSFQTDLLRTGIIFSSSVAAADLNGDGRADLVTTTTEFNNDAVVVMLGNGDGSFQPERRFAVGISPATIAVADFNRDGRPDLVTANYNSNNLSVLLGNGDGFFLRRDVANTVDPRHTPYLGDLDSDGTPDTVVLNDAGDILFRRGLPNTDNLFAPPAILNLDFTTENQPFVRRAREITLVEMDDGLAETSARLAVAASDSEGSTVSLYAFTGDGFTRTIVANIGGLPQRIATADLDGDGLADDLVIANTLGNSVTIAFQQKGGSFTGTRTLPAGVTPSDITFADMDSAFGLDVIVSNRSSGDVVVLYNDSDHTFARTARYRAGIGIYSTQDIGGVLQPRSVSTGIYGTQNIGGVLQPRSRVEPVAVVAGLFTGDALPDLVVVNDGSNSFGTLIGTPGGGFINPSEAFRFSTSQGLRINDSPGQTVVGDFNADGEQDVAILMEDGGEVWLFAGAGDGTFSLLTTIPAGNISDGLSAKDIDGDGDLDLMVGNGFGDILFILGNGDGTFSPFVRADKRLPFVASDLNGDGVTDVFLADQARDLASAHLRVEGTNTFVPGAFHLDGANGLIGPGDVALANLDGRYGTDLIFANTGSNNVLIYLRKADGTFRTTPLSFFAGTGPTDLHVTQLNDDNKDGKIDSHDLIDLVIANQGSNDVSVLLGSRGVDVNRDGTVNGKDLFRLGPRLATVDRDGTTSALDVFGPSFVSTQFLNGDKIPDIIAASTQSSTATLVPGRGNGFFNDVNRTTIDLGGLPRGLDRNFVLLDNGHIVAADFTGVTTLFAGDSRQAVAFAAADVPGFASPVFFTVNSDGSSSALVSLDGVSYSEFANQATGLGDPSALAVLQTSNGVEVFISDARDGGLVVLRFDIGDPVVGVVPVGGTESLALVATLTNSLLVENRLVPSEFAADPFTVFGLEEQAAGLALIDGVFISLGKQLLSGLEDETDGPDPDLPPPNAAPATWQQFLAGLDEALRQLGWTPPAEKELPGIAPEEEPFNECSLRRGQDITGPLHQIWQKIQLLAASKPSIPDKPNVPAAECSVPEVQEDRAEPLPAEEMAVIGEAVLAVLPESSELARETSGVTPLNPLLSTAVFASGLYAGRTTSGNKGPRRFSPLVRPSHARS